MIEPAPAFAADVSQFLTEFEAFEADLPEGERKRSRWHRLKAFAKKDLARDSDGRLHGDHKNMGRMIDVAINLWKFGDKNFPDDDNWTEHVWTASITGTPLSQIENFPYTLKKLAPLARTSTCARRLYMSRLLSREGHMELADGDGIAAAHWFAHAYRLSELPVMWTTDQMSLADAVFSQLIDDRMQPVDVQTDSFQVRAQIRMLRGNLIGALADLRAAQRLTPDDPALHTIEASLCNDLGRPREALAALDRAEALATDDIESTLFVRGCILQNLCESAAARRCLEEYVRLASPDERKVCEAHYHLAMLEFQQNSLGAARRALDRGVVAESKRLPCFKDFKSNFRQPAELLLAHVHACGREECTQAADLKCECREIYYCGPECQKMHWKIHKRTCAYRAERRKQRQQ